MATLVISPSGTLTFIYDDELQPLVSEGDATISRVSHVEPNSAGCWVADMSPVGGPELGPFDLREEALTAEKLWLSVHLGL